MPEIPLTEAASQLGISLPAIRKRFRRRQSKLTGAGHAVKVAGVWKLTPEGVDQLGQDYSSAATPPPETITTADLEIGFLRRELRDAELETLRVSNAALEAEVSRLRTELRTTAEELAAVHEAAAASLRTRFGQA